MSTDILAIVIAVIVGGIVTIAWRIRAAVDKKDEGPRVQQPVTPKGLENKQAELSKTPDRISETKPTAAKPKAVKKKTVKTSPRKTVSKSKKKKA